MKDSLDPLVVKNLDPLDMQDYLISLNWRIVERIGNKGIILYREGDEVDILLPLNRMATDFYSRCIDIINHLSESVNQPRDMVFQNMLNYGADIVNFRIDSPFSKDGTLPMEDAVIFYSNVKDLILSAARAVVEVKPKYTSAIPSNIKSFYEDLRVGQTRKGSYIVSIILKHKRTSTEKQYGKLDIREPFERSVFNTLQKAIHTLDAITEDNGMSEDLVYEAVYSGVSYNLCRAVLEMQKSTKGGKMEVKFEWSPRFEKPKTNVDLIIFDTVQITNIEKAQNILSKPADTSRQRLYGVVIGLQRHEGALDGKVTLNALYDGKSIKVSLILGAVEYSGAAKAHDEGTQVSCVGDLKRVGNFFYMDNVKDFRVISDSRQRIL